MSGLVKRFILVSLRSPLRTEFCVLLHMVPDLTLHAAVLEVPSVCRALGPGVKSDTSALDCVILRGVLAWLLDGGEFLTSVARGRFRNVSNHEDTLTTNETICRLVQPLATLPPRVNVVLLVAGLRQALISALRGHANAEHAHRDWLHRRLRAVVPMNVGPTSRHLWLQSPQPSMDRMDRMPALACAPAPIQAPKGNPLRFPL